MEPEGEVRVDFGKCHVKVPFSGVEPTTPDVIGLALTSLRAAGLRPRPSEHGFALVPIGAEEDLHFELVPA